MKKKGKSVAARATSKPKVEDKSRRPALRVKRSTMGESRIRASFERMQNMSRQRSAEDGLSAGEAQLRNEEELRRSHSLLNATLESTADGILVVALDGKVTSYNRKFLDLWRIPESLAAQGDDRALMEFVLNQLKDPSGFISKVEALYSAPESTSFDELEFLDGRIFERYSQPQRLAGAVIGRVWSFRDVTERTRAEKALRESEARLLTVLEASPIPLSLTSFENGVILYGNSSLAGLLGVSHSDVIGQKAVDFYADPEDRVRMLAALDRLGSIRDYETRLCRLNGVVIWVSIASEKIMFEGQDCILSCLYEITERKQAEALQAAVYQISEAANKAVSTDELFRSVHSIIGQVMPAQNFYIALFDELSNLLSFPYYVDEVDVSASIPATQPGRGMTEYILRTGKPLLSDAANFEELARMGEVELVGPPSPIWIGAPLIVEGGTIGVIALQDYHNPKVYSERELRMLEFVSGQVAKAIERTRLYENIQRNNRILTALQEATLPLIKQTELSEVLQAIAVQAAQFMETAHSFVYLVDSDERTIQVVIGTGIFARNIGFKLLPGEGLAGKIWQTAQSLTIHDYHVWSGRSTLLDDTEIHGIVGVPLMTGPRVIGVLGLAYAEMGRTFGQEDVDLLSRFAQLASIAFENARLYTLNKQELSERTMAEEALREAEAKYRTVVEHISAITYTAAMDEAKTRLYVSPQIETLLGYTQEEYLTDPDLWKKILHPQDRDRVVAASKKFYESGEPLVTDYRNVARDGRILWFHDEAVIFEDKSTHKRFIQGIKVDITPRVQAEALQLAIYRISDAASLSGSMDEFYRAIHESLQSVMIANNFFIALFDKETDLLRFPYYVDENDPIPNTALLGLGPTAYVIRNGIPLFGKSETMKKLEEQGVLEPAGTRSIDWLGVPLKIENETIGVMAVQTYTEGIRYTQRDLDILKFVSTQVALSIERKRSAESLRAAETRYRTLIEQLPIVVYVNPAENVDATVYVSPQIKELLGYTQEEWLKDPAYWRKALHPEDRARLLAQVDKMRYESNAFDEEYRMIARDGSIVWVRDQATLLHDSEGRPLLWQGLMVDISDRKQAEGRIKLQIERLKALRTIDMFIASGTDLHLTLQTILRQAVSQLGVDAADILLLNQSMHVLEFSEGLGFRTRGIEQTTLRVGEGFAGRAVLQREMVSVEDLRTYEQHPLFILEGLIAYHCIPLIAKGEVKGVLEVFNRSRLDSDDEWMDFLESLAGQAALAVDNASLFESLQRTNIELSLAYETTLEGWSAALDLRDKETEGHTQRVTELTLKLAHAMGVDEKERIHIRRGALLHDIGKMGIPDRILLKPDVLTGEEWEIMRQHPVYAHNLLSKIEHLRPALDIPYCHHERWDGSGYPRGLKMEVIPLAARIFAVADVWDALCSDRPYRPAWSREQALSYIKSLSGVHFDPRVVEAFLQVVQEE